MTDYSVYLRNMAGLWRHDARLAMQIDAVPDEAILPTEPSKSGPGTLAMEASDGKRVWLHSRYDPRAEAEKFVDGIDMSEAFCFVVGGFGLGHHLKALYERLRGDAFIIVTEPNLVLIRTALMHVDLSDLLNSGRCVILTQAETSHLHEKLQPHNTMMMLGTQIVSHPASNRIAGEFHAALRTMITDYASYCRMTVMTLVGNSRITNTNVANNLPTYVATPPIDVLQGRYAGYPGIVVAAGPSLHRNIDLLAELSDRAVICTVQSTYKTLLRRDIAPDFVTSLDFHEQSRRFFEGIEDFRGTHLVAEPKATWHVIDTFKGPVSLLYNEFAEKCLGKDLAYRGGLPAGTTVAHLAFYLAQYLGCDPIIFVGQDLAFTDHSYYAPGSPAHDGWRGELNRFNAMETKEWEKIIRARKVLRKVPDVHGQEIYTDEQMFTYLQQFQSDFAKCPARIIDATEGGAAKVGAESMTLAEAAARFCTRPIPRQLDAYRAEAPVFEAGRLPPARARLAARREELIKFRELCQKTIDLLRKLTDLADKPGEFNRVVAQVDEVRSRVQQHQTVYEMVSGVSQMAELRRFTADRKIKADDPSGLDRARRQLTRDVDFIEHMLEGCDALDKILSGAIERFDRAMEARGVS
ncbi:MAG: motility associated factor glycosyltransferase family protein [Phycisphaerae bacterium]|nr:motility associated factor glycosyltransferase family protein [Phycisphaerae bacterium]